MPYHVGDTAPALTGKLTSDGTPVNLTGATVEVHLKNPDHTVTTIAATTGTDGAWVAPWPAPITQAGRYDVEVQVTYSGGGIQTFGPQNFHVYAQIA